MLDAWWVFSDQRTVAHLELDECRQLLATESLGRIALSVQALPAVVPVFFHLSGNRVVFPVETDALYAALSDNIVAFEVDHIDVGTHEGWAVVAVGRSGPVFDVVPAVHELDGEDAPSTAVRLIGINLDRLSGRRASGRPIDALQAPA
jgi:nitroimidazol reductase NimA-like FMN-containing flavoprotein (pyridoxamine 5'-phosphate oxidase superfamily)